MHAQSRFGIEVAAGQAGGATSYVRNTTYLQDDTLFLANELAGTGLALNLAFVFTDQAGMPTHVEDATGRLVWSATPVDAYGGLRVDASSELEFHLRWPGHRYDPDTGLHDNRYRAYDPTRGRYLQTDPIGVAGGTNTYAYAPNPLVQVDVLGLAHDGVSPPTHASGTPPTATERLRDSRGRCAPDPDAPSTGRIGRDAAGRTYKGRGGPARQATVAGDLRLAAERDMATHRDTMIAEGRDPAEVDAWAEQVHARNEPIGLYDETPPSSLWEAPEND